MYKISLFMALLCASTTLFAAPLASLYGGVNHGQVNIQGRAGGGGYSASLTQQLGYGNTEQTTLYLGVTHAIPVLPNARVAYSSYKQSAVHRTGPMTFDSTLDVKTTDLSLYYSPVKTGLLRVDVGLDIRYMDVDFALAVSRRAVPIHATHQTAHQLLPAVFAKLHSNLGASGLYANAVAYYSRYDNRRLTQGRAGIGWRVGRMINLEVGYQYELQRVISDAIYIDMTTQGPYASVALSF